MFTSEIDTHALKTYRANHPSLPGHQFAGDIRTVRSQDIPAHDLLMGGFPCQAFSLQGVSKRNALGRTHGLTSETGALFFEVVRILQDLQPAGFLLENVKNLVYHNKQETFREVIDRLEGAGYVVYWKVYDAALVVPQHRERVFLVGVRNDIAAQKGDFLFPEITPSRRLLGDILHRDDESPAAPYTQSSGGKTGASPRYTLSDKLWAFLQAYREKHNKAGNGFGYTLVTPTSVARTLSQRYYKDGSEILVYQEGRNPRRLTPRECARLMGFSDDFRIPVSDTQAYRQFGNAVVPLLVARLQRALVDYLGGVYAGGGSAAVLYDVVSTDSHSADLLPAHPVAGHTWR